MNPPPCDNNLQSRGHVLALPTPPLQAQSENFRRQAPQERPFSGTTSRTSATGNSKAPTDQPWLEILPSHLELTRGITQVNRQHRRHLVIPAKTEH